MIIHLFCGALRSSCDSESDNKNNDSVVNSVLGAGCLKTPNGVGRNRSHRHVDPPVTDGDGSLWHLAMPPSNRPYCHRRKRQLLYETGFEKCAELSGGLGPEPVFTRPRSSCSAWKEVRAKPSHHGAGSALAGSRTQNTAPCEAEGAKPAFTHGAAPVPHGKRCGHQPTPSGTGLTLSRVQ